MGDRVGEAFAATPRGWFLPRLSRFRAAADAPVLIGHGQTNSQPSTVAAMLRLLDVRPGDRVLDVGSGSGWTTALLAHLTGPTGEVLGVEVVPQLVRYGARHLERTERPWARIEAARPGVLGAPDAAPYDAVLVSADGGRLRQELVDQLAPGGRLVLPVAGVMMKYVDGEVTTHGRYRFVPLV